MRKFIVLSMISLDGVLQAPGGDQEDPSNGFRLGGWTEPYTDAIYSQAVRQELQPAEYLLGRKTFEIWEHYWPEHGDFWPGINAGKKHVLSRTRDRSDWDNTVFLPGIEPVKELKQSRGADIQVWGSSELVHLLLRHDLVDELRLKIHPVILGKGKNLFHEEASPAAFTLTESTVTTTGVILANYKRSGEVQTGNIEA